VQASTLETSAHVRNHLAFRMRGLRSRSSRAGDVVRKAPRFRGGGESQMEETTQITDVEDTTEVTEDDQLLEQYGVLVSAEYYNFG